MLASFRIAVRSLARRPAVATVAIVSLAVGIGVNSAVFSVVDSAFLRLPEVVNPENLLRIAAAYKDSGALIDWSDYQELSRQTSAFSAVTASMGRGGLWRNGEEMTLLLSDTVAGNYFEVLGVKPALGLLPDAKYDYSGDSEPPIVLAWWFWRERMGGRSDVIGERMEYRSHLWRIAAVLPPRFRGLEPLGARHVWIPVSAWAKYFREDLNRNNGQFAAIARLRPGVSKERALAQLELLSKHIEASDSRVPKGRRFAAYSMAADLRDRLRLGILVMGPLLLVLLVACANVAAVLLAHAEARRREIGLRLSLGAGRIALMRQFLTESAVLAVSGSIAGLLLALWMLRLVPAFAPTSSIPLNYTFQIDHRVLLYAAGCCLLTLTVFIAPLFYAVRVPIAESISGARATGRGPRSFSRFALITAQVALSVVLVGGAVVLTRALKEASEIYPGFDASRPLALIWTNLTGDARPAYRVFEEAAQRVAGTGSVEAVTYARHLSIVGSGSGATITVTPEGWRLDAPPPRVYFNLVGPKFFEVTGARMVSGRSFADSDHNGSAPVAIVNAEGARRFWPGENPLGKTLRLASSAYEVIGVAADSPIGGLHQALAPALYLPASRMPSGEAILIARTRPDPAIVVKELARAAAKTSGLRVYETDTLRGLMRDSLYEDWIPTVLGGLLATIGLLLAAGGLYGATSYATERRLSEFGVRMALGARASEIGGLVLRQAAVLCAAGLPLGIALFAVIYRHYSPTLLHGRPLDLVAILLGSLIAVAAVLAGAVLPAWRAARLDPVNVLRAE
jgi:predicted permease